MNRLLAVGVLMACLCTPVLAEKDLEKFDLPWNVDIGDLQLPAGRCVITWTDASGAEVQLTIKAVTRSCLRQSPATVFTVSRRVNDTEPSFQVPSTFTYTSVTLNGLTTSLPPTTATGGSC